MNSQSSVRVERYSECRLPTEYGAFQVIAYREQGNPNEHLAIVRGDVQGAREVLCRALNALRKGAVGRVSDNKTRFKQLENLEAYKSACLKIGVPEKDCLDPVRWLDGGAADLETLYSHLLRLAKALPDAPPLSLSADAVAKASPRTPRKGSLMVHNRMGSISAAQLSKERAESVGAASPTRK